MGILTHILSEECELLTTSKTKYGDQEQTATTTVSCRFRYITNVDKNLNAEAINSDATIWLDVDTDASEGQIVKYGGKYWRIDRLIKAHRFTSEILFTKAFVQRHDISVAS